jgi:hypothetical protein
MATRKNLIPPGPYSIEPTADPDDGSEYAILAGDEQIATTYDYAGIPGSARALAELIVKALEQRPRR